MKTPLRILISRRKKDLEASSPKSRDQLRHRLNVLLVVQVLRRKGRAA